MRNLRYIFLLLLSLLPFFEAEAGQHHLLGRNALRNPIVLVHGATTKGSELQIGMFNFGTYFRFIKAYYEATGTPVYVAHLSTDGSIGERAAVLKNFLETELKGKMVNIVAHSLGGLDARYAASVLHAAQIASITTIGTPHHGTPLADWAVRQTNRHLPWYWFFRVLGYDMKTRRFLREITTDFMKNTFNKRVPNVVDIKYFSVVTSASFRNESMSFWLWFPSLWLEGESHPMANQPNDGMVPVESQKWGTQISQQELDHLGQINHHSMRARSFESTAYMVYMTIYDTLAKSGL